MSVNIAFSGYFTAGRFLPSGHWFYGAHSLIVERAAAFPVMRTLGGGLDVCAAPMGMLPPGGGQRGGDMLGSWAEGLAGRREPARGRGRLRFAFYGRVSTEDWQDPVTSRARQL
jgi:hypothetical protein